MNSVSRGVMMISFFFRPSVGGLETHMDDLCKYLTAQSHRVFVVTFQPLTSSRYAKIIERAGNLTVYRVPTPLHNMFYRFQSRTLLRYLILTPFLVSTALVVMALHRKEIDVIHCHDLNSAPVCAFISWMFNRKSVLTVHYVQDFLSGSSGSAFDNFGKFVLSRFHSVIAISGKVRDALLPLLGDSGKLKTMTYWIDMDVFKPPADREALRREHASKFIALFVGRLVSTKGIDLILGVASSLRQESDISFSFVGQGPMMDTIVKASEESGNVDYLGTADPARLSEIYGMADVLLVPSVYEEGFGRVIMESLACGTPVIGSRRGAIPEAMDDSVGILIDPSVEALRGAVLELRGNRRLLENLSSRCRGYAVRRFSSGNASVVLSAYSWE